MRLAALFRPCSPRCIEVHITVISRIRCVYVTGRTPMTIPLDGVSVLKMNLLPIADDGYNFEF